MKHVLLSSLFVSVLGIGAIAACGGGKGSATQTPRSGADDPSCPVSVPGTSVTVEDTDSGAALVFVTTGDVAELRKRVAAMAKMHNEHHGAMGALPDGKDAGGGHDMSKMGGGTTGSGGAMGSGHDMSKMGSGHDMSKMGSGHDMSKMGGGTTGSGGAMGSGHDMGAMGSGHDMGAMGSGHDMGAMGSGHDMGAMSGGMIGVHAKAESVDVEGGAKLVLTSGAADVAKLQSELRTHAQQLATGTCAMEHR